MPRVSRAESSRPVKQSLDSVYWYVKCLIAENPDWIRPQHVSKPRPFVLVNTLNLCLATIKMINIQREEIPHWSDITDIA
jgi:hypothetical protein